MQTPFNYMDLIATLRPKVFVCHELHLTEVEAASLWTSLSADRCQSTKSKMGVTKVFVGGPGIEIRRVINDEDGETMTIDESPWSGDPEGGVGMEVAGGKAAGKGSNAVFAHAARCPPRGRGMGSSGETAKICPHRISTPHPGA